MASTSLNTETIPIRMAENLREQLKRAAEQMETSQQNAARLAMQIGLQDLESINYEVADAVFEKVQRARTEPSARGHLKRSRQKRPAPGPRTPPAARPGSQAEHPKA